VDVEATHELLPGNLGDFALVDLRRLDGDDYSPAGSCGGPSPFTGGVLAGGGGGGAVCIICARSGTRKTAAPYGTATLPVIAATVITLPAVAAAKAATTPARIA